MMIHAHIEKDIAYLTLDRPDKANALDEAGCHALHEHLAKLQEKVQCIVLQGKGKHFCAGADLTWIKPLSAHGRIHALEPLKHSLHLLSTGIPSVAHVHGACRGGGVGLVAACQAAYAQPNTTFACPERSQGIEPSIILPYLQKKIAKDILTPWLDHGAVISEHTAKTWGLIDEITGPTHAANECPHKHKT